MSHIPAAAMPHAKPHPDLPAPVATPPAPGPNVPWAALFVGGALAIGGIVAATWLTRRKPAPKRRRKGGRRRAAKKS